MFVLDPTIVVWKAITAAVWWQNPEDQYWSDIGQNFCNNYGTFDPIPKSKSSTTTCRQQGHDHLSVSSSRLLEEKGIRLILISADVAISVSDMTKVWSHGWFECVNVPGCNSTPLHLCVKIIYQDDRPSVSLACLFVQRTQCRDGVDVHRYFTSPGSLTDWLSVRCSLVIFGSTDEWTEHAVESRRHLRVTLTPPPVPLTPQLGYSICPTLKY